MPVLAGNILEHLRDPAALLRRIRPVLSEDTLLIVALPNVANLRVRLDLLRGRFDYTDTGIMDRTHLHLYTYRTARALLTENEFLIKDEHAGSITFGRFLNSKVPGARRLQPLLANTIIMRASPHALGHPHRVRRERPDLCSRCASPTEPLVAAQFTGACRAPAR